MKDVSISMHSSASFNGFTLKNLFKNGANDMSQMVNIAKQLCVKKL